MPQGRVLSVDYGERRIGLAMTDPDRIVASGFTTLTVVSEESAVDAVLKIIREYEIAEIVVGIPLRCDGSMTPKADKIRAFCAKLSEKAGISILEWDESFSSVEAKRLVLQSETKKKRRNKEKIDELAALVILREFLGHY